MQTEHPTTLEACHCLIEQLQDALRTRDVIGQAKGILMATGAVTEDEAFTILVRASQRENRKLRDVAADLARANAARSVRTSEGTSTDETFENGTRGAIVVALAGEIDMATAPAVADTLQAAVDAGARDLTVDMADVGFMDSQGLYPLLEAQEAITARGGRFALRSPSTSVRLVIELSGVESRLLIE